MTAAMLEPQEGDEQYWAPGPLGESSKGCCKVINGNSCGSGSLVGKRDGKSLVLTNAHVAGTRIGHQVQCEFPFAENRRVNARVIMAGYSDRVMMDWAVLEIESEQGNTLVAHLPHTKLKNEAPNGKHYTAGYPRCRGPYFSELTTRAITHSGTVWRWQPNSIGGQSGSAVHSPRNGLQYGLLTWSWGGDGAGQTVRAIWFQYANRAVVGFPRPEGLVEVGERAKFLEEGFFQEANITELPIWDHLDSDEPKPDAKPDGKLAQALLEIAGHLVEIAESLAPERDSDKDSPGSKPDDPIFGL